MMTGYTIRIVGATPIQMFVPSQKTLTIEAQAELMEGDLYNASVDMLVESSEPAALSVSSIGKLTFKGASSTFGRLFVTYRGSVVLNAVAQPSSDPLELHVSSTYIDGQQPFPEDIYPQVKLSGEITSLLGAKAPDGSDLYAIYDATADPSSASPSSCYAVWRKTAALAFSSDSTFNGASMTAAKIQSLYNSSSKAERACVFRIEEPGMGETGVKRIAAYVPSSTSDAPTFSLRWDWPYDAAPAQATNSHSVSFKPYALPSVKVPCYSVDDIRQPELIASSLTPSTIEVLGNIKSEAIWASKARLENATAASQKTKLSLKAMKKRKLVYAMSEWMSIGYDVEYLGDVSGTTDEIDVRATLKMHFSSELRRAIPSDGWTLHVEICTHDVRGNAVVKRFEIPGSQIKSSASGTANEFWGSSQGTRHSFATSGTSEQLFDSCIFLASSSTMIATVDAGSTMLRPYDPTAAGWDDDAWLFTSAGKLGVRNGTALVWNMKRRIFISDLQSYGFLERNYPSHPASSTEDTTSFCVRALFEVDDVRDDVKSAEMGTDVSYASSYVVNIDPSASSYWGSIT